MVEEAALVALLEEAPDGVVVLLRHREVGVVPIHPVAQPDRLVGLNRGELEHSLGYCDAAIEVNNRNWRAYNNRALVYMELDRYEEAEADVIRGQQLAPSAKSLKVVKGMLLDETHPVSPNIIIDDRRNPDEDEG